MIKVFLFTALLLFLPMGTWETKKTTSRSIASSIEESCSKLLLRLFHRASNNKILDSIVSFNDMLESQPKWRRNLYDSLWRGNIERGEFTIINSSSVFMFFTKAPAVQPIGYVQLGLRTVDFRLHPFQMPLNVKDAYVEIAKKYGFVPGKEVVAIPVKMIMSQAAGRPVTTVLFLLGIGGAGEIVSSMGLLGSTPLLNKVDTSNYSDNEVLLIIKNCKSTKEDRDAATSINDGIIEKHLARDPEHIKLLDLTTYTPSDGIKFLKGKKIKRVIVSGHGSRGRVSIDSNVGGLSLSKYAAYLKEIGIDQYFDQHVDIYFNSCLLSHDEYGKMQVSLFAEELIPHSGTVTTNNYVGISGNNQSPLVVSGINDLAEDALFYVVSPAVLPGKIIAYTIMTRFLMHSDDPWQNYTYTYTKE